MVRGDVVLLPAMSFPDGNEKAKYVIMLREWAVPDHPTGGQAAVVVANTDKRKPGMPTQPFQAELGAADGFDHATIVDGRWVYTIAMKKILGSDYQFKLSAAAMKKVDGAITQGLSLSP